MKKTFPVIALLAAAFSFSGGLAPCRAQEPEAPVVSPEVHADGTVTFRLRADKAAEVAISGDFFSDDVPYPAKMTREADGLWTYTTPAPLPSEQYTYAFRIDGVRTIDPANAFAFRNTSAYYSYFLVPGGRADLYAVQDVPHGTIAKVWYPSPALHKSRRMTVYTPPGYAESADSLPVLYLLHGHGNDEDAWEELGNVAQIMDNLLAQGLIAPMLVVMPNGNAVEAASPGHSPSRLVNPETWMSAEREMDGAYETSFPDIIDYVEHHYRVLSDKAHRAIAGLSMGGYHTQHISMAYPNLFDYVGIFSGVVGIYPDADTPVYTDRKGKLAAQFAQAPKVYWIAIGKDDFLYKNNVDYRAYLDEMGYPYTYRESSGGHSWANWRIYLTEFSQMLFRK